MLRAKYAVPKVKPTVVGTTLGYWTDNGGLYYGPEQLTTAKAGPLFSQLAAQHVQIGYTQLDPWAWQDYAKTAEVKEPDGSVHWVGAGQLVSWTAEPSFFPTDGFAGLAKAGAVATPGKAPMPLLLYSLWWEENKTAAFYKAKYGEDYSFVSGAWKRSLTEQRVRPTQPL